MTESSSNNIFRCIILELKTAQNLSEIPLFLKKNLNKVLPDKLKLNLVYMLLCSWFMPFIPLHTSMHFYILFSFFLLHALHFFIIIILFVFSTITAKKRKPRSNAF